MKGEKADEVVKKDDAVEEDEGHVLKMWVKRIMRRIKRRIKRKVKRRIKRRRRERIN